ncbi:GntR family transcriptional regulator [Oceanobacillus jeddahense]|uniref:GntR family transcriptional regulator n=1 Tax=Oceanobacillus jeddahense TaxID=1462527 RepID=UPI001652A0A7|nr:GntR family transcriptional regulator [Oceanobacillus jeddahense]
MKIVKAKPLYMQVHGALRQEIINGKLNYGERINEVKISQTLEVSRGPVRESISKLEQEGLLVRDEKNVLRVYTPNADDLKNIYECRRALESLAAEKAAESISDQGLADLEQLMVKSSKVLDEKDDLEKSTTQFLELNSEFHHIIIQAGENKRLLDQVAQLKSLTRLYRKFNIHNHERRAVAHSQHYNIFLALKDRDSKKAKELMDEHIQYDMESLLNLFLRIK